jgi:immune inhibitor A
VRVLVVLVDFSDKQFAVDTARFEELFFSTGSLVTGSVKEYFTTSAAGSSRSSARSSVPCGCRRRWSGTRTAASASATPRRAARALPGRERRARGDGVTDLRPYDNDGDGYVDAFVVVHAGRAARRPVTRATCGPTSGCCRRSTRRTARRSSPT